MPNRLSNLFVAESLFLIEVSFAQKQENNSYPISLQAQGFPVTSSLFKVVRIIATLAAMY